MSRRERWLRGALILLALLAARGPLHRATFRLPVSNDDAIPLMMAERVLHGELATILWNQPYNGTLDTYLLAPLVAVASPHAAFRFYEIACGLVLVAMAGLLAAGVAGEKAGWAAALLAAVGTPYMALMAATGPTPNFLVPLLVGAVVLLALRHGVRPLGAGALLGMGLLCGLAIWDSFLALPALAGAAAGLWLADVRPRPRALALIAVGAAVGALPLLIARLDGASGATPVTSMRPRWLWTAGIRDLVRAAQGLFGIEVPLVVDGPERAALPALAAVVLAACLALSLVLGATRRRALPLTGWVIALAAAFAFSRRTGGDEVRYLFGAALPVLALAAAGIAERLQGLRPPLRALVTAAIAAGLAVPWLLGQRILVERWRDPTHAAQVWQVPPLGDALARLRAASIRSAYASLQFAARLTVESGHRVIGSQAWNERIPGDPLRYRDEVDLDPRPAWVLSNILSRGMPRAGGFRQLLADAGGGYKEDVAGDVTVFHDFRPPYDESRAVPAAAITLTTMDGAALPASVADNDASSAWTSPAALARGSGIVVAVSPARRLSAIVMLVGLDPTPLGVPWVAEADGVVIARGPARGVLQWVNGAPRAGRQALLVVPLRDRALGQVRILFQGEGPPLTIAEVFAYGPDEPAAPDAGAEPASQAYDRVRAGQWSEAVRLYEDASRADPHRASHHAALARSRWRAARRQWLDVESLGDGGPALFERR